MASKVRILLSGPGLIGRQHAQRILAHPDCVLAGIVAPPIPENLEWARTYSLQRYDTLEQALDGAMPLDAVIISAPNACHFDQAALCIDRNLPALVEKPVTDRLDTARQLAQAASAKGVPILVGHHRTHSGLISVARAFLQSPDFGNLVAVQGSALFYKPAHYFAEGPWRTQIGGGPILINLIHEIGFIRHLCGEFVRISAIASNASRGFAVEDSVSLSFELSTGALGTFLLSDTAASANSWEMTSGENPAYPYYPEGNCYHFAGTMGSLDFPSMQVKHYPAGTEPSWWSPFCDGRLSTERSDPLDRQLDHFLDVIRGTAAPLVSAQDGYANMLVVDAIGHAVREDRTITIETA